MKMKAIKKGNGIIEIKKMKEVKEMKINRITRKCYFLVMLIVLTGLNCQVSGCMSTTLDAPCSDYGAYCSKIPINSWDYHRT